MLVRPDVADHDFHVVAHAVVHLPDAARAAVAHHVLGGIVVQTDVVRAAAPERKRDALLRGNARLGQRQPHVARGTHEDDAVLLAQADGGQRLARAGGRNVEDQLGQSVVLERRENLLLVLVQLRVAALEHVLVFLHELVRLLDERGGIKLRFH